MKSNSYKKQIALIIWLIGAITCCQATITTTGQVTNDDGTIQWDWVTHFPGNIIIGYDDYGTLDVSGNNPALNFGYISIAKGDNTTGSFTMRNGANVTQPFYQNHYIYIAGGVNSEATMTLRGIDTFMRLSDHVYLGLKDGSDGELIVKEGAVLEYSELYAGHSLGGYGKVIVEDLGSQLVTWVNNKYTQIGRLGTGELIIRNKGYARTGGYAEVGYGDRSHGTATITGKDSLWEIAGVLTVGRGAGYPSQPAEGVLILARGGKVFANATFIGGATYGGMGTLGFVIGDIGTGAVNCGLLETTSLSIVNAHADFQMNVDPGVNLAIGTQYTLVDYGTLGSGRFTGISEGDIYTSPEGYHFRINYATDLGGGDLAITATVTDLPPCVVDDVDLYLVTSHWMEAGCEFDNNCDGADLDLNGQVDLGDIATIARQWLAPCPTNWPWQ